MVCDQPTSSDGALVADLCVLREHTFLNLRCCLTIFVCKVALFYIRVVDTDIMSYFDQTSLAVLSSAEHEKKRKYSQACRDRRASTDAFLLLVWWVVRLHAAFLKQVADLLSATWDKVYGSVMGSICTLCATLLYIRGCHSLGIIDGGLLLLIINNRYLLVIVTNDLYDDPSYYSDLALLIGLM